MVKEVCFCILLLALLPAILAHGSKQSTTTYRINRSNRKLLGDVSSKDDHKSSSSSPRNLTMAASGVLILCCGFLCPCFWRRRREMEHHVLSKSHSIGSSSSLVELNNYHEKFPGSPMRSPPRFSMSPKLNSVTSVHLNLSQIAKATQNFSSSMKIGEGGFGNVYKALLTNGQIVAVKQAKQEVFDALKTEFTSEIELLAKVEHRNLVKLLGYVNQGREHLIIMEYVPNGNLREHLDGLRGKSLDFNQRLQIAIDVAHALIFLHLYSERQIIHRDVKSSNILLTDSKMAKVADFGFARLGANPDSNTTHIVTQVRGTMGYLDPEYMRTHKLTPKSDVFSFGILLVEILTGRRPIEPKKPDDEIITVRWAFNNCNEGKVMQLVDPLMKETIEEDVLERLFGLAFECAAPTRSDRPDMEVVGERLWGIRMDYLRKGGKG
ncbi:calmodulin-binding receptor-like cytoplasmic kinase 3 isoform X2 [Impatiens glandulifera]|uniref:calmodulin-binding receptor-like cytoplasmic kinase 3 isoform X2 n=1 Tax=Impatiens glandulifera TaxID=253017 RepID=UPI001FB10704|nr:calmodulin-binding receptor-like cytoplasmic kinase 3 isoform X2 [Impatiens glandulifera]